MNRSDKGNQNNKKKVKKSANKNHHEKKSTEVSNESVTPSQSKPKEDLINLKKLKIFSPDVAKSGGNDGANTSNLCNDPFIRNCETNINRESKQSNDNLVTVPLFKLNRNSKSEMEKAFDTYMNFIRMKRSMEYKCVVEIEADLFSMDKEYHLAHCVAEDFNMGSGIALQFRKQFNDVDLLLNQRVRQGGYGILESEGRYIYYLVTKRESNGKPTLETMFKSVYKMKGHIVKNNVKKLALPRIGCGLDRLEWSEVKNMLEFVFEDTECMITICNFQKNYGKTKQKLQTKSIESKDSKWNKKLKKRQK